MATTGLTMYYFDPIISKKEPQFFGPGKGGFKIGQEGTNFRLSHMEISPMLRIKKVGI